MQNKKETTGGAGRRDFIKTTIAGAAITAAALSGITHAADAVEKKSGFTFPPLPYPENALEPFISSKTLSVHHDKHHYRFVQEVVARVKGTKYQYSDFETVIKETYGSITMIETLHLMALLSWNHEFYFNSMKPAGGGEIPATLKAAIIESYGSVDTCITKFKEAAMTLGSGWAWLVVDNGKVAVTYTVYHDTPLLKNQRPLITIDCWEHAYYLDYQDRKSEYVDAYVNKLVNWQFAEKNYLAAVPTAAVPAPEKKK